MTMMVGQLDAALFSPQAPLPSPASGGSGHKLLIGSMENSFDAIDPQLPRDSSCGYRFT